VTSTLLGTVVLPTAWGRVMLMAENSLWAGKSYDPRESNSCIKNLEPRVCTKSVAWNKLRKNPLVDNRIKLKSVKRVAAKLKLEIKYYRRNKEGQNLIWIFSE
jgi:hypothetical protein